jgi:hypothetical protein
MNCIAEHVLLVASNLNGYKHITNASTRFATFGILCFFEFTVLSGKFRLNLHGSKRVMQALTVQSEKFQLAKVHIDVNLYV